MTLELFAGRQGVKLFDVRARPSSIALLTALCVSGTARAELRPISRNSLVFVESSAEGEEWEAYRVADARQPVVLAVEGPGRVLIRVRATLDGAAEAGVAAILHDDRIVLTARVEPTADPKARVADGSVKNISKARLYLVRVGEGSHRVTVRYSGGPTILVSARFSAPLMEEWEISERDDGELPLAPLTPLARRPRPSLDALGRPGAATEDAPAGDADLPVERASEEPPPTSDPLAEVQPAAEPRAAGQVALPRRDLTVRAPYLTFELSGGVRANRIGPHPEPSLGLGVRFFVPGLDARRFTLGVAADVAHTSGDAVVRRVAQGAPIDIASVARTLITGAVDLRYAFASVPGALEAYGSVGAGAVGGWVSTQSASGRLQDGVRGGFAVAAAGITLGSEGSRPFMELRGQGGQASSALSRERGEAGGATYATLGIFVGYRLELLTDVAIE